MADRVGQDEIRGGLEGIAETLTSPRILTSFGGCAMTVRGIKDATKDVDLVVHPPGRFHELIADLERAGYDMYVDPVREELEPPEEMEEIRGWEVFMGPLHLDLFPARRIFRRLSFSDAMAGRAETWFERGKLTARLADPSTIFLLKCVTGRWRQDPQRDLPDLEDLLARDIVDFDFVASEWREQLDSVPEPAEVTELAQEAVDHLRATGYAIPWSP